MSVFIFSFERGFAGSVGRSSTAFFIVCATGAFRTSSFLFTILVTATIPFTASSMVFRVGRHGGRKVEENGQSDGGSGSRLVKVWRIKDHTKAGSQPQVTDRKCWCQASGIVPRPGGPVADRESFQDGWRGRTMRLSCWLVGWLCW